MSEDRTLTLTRHIAAPAAVVWRCWTDPTILPRWFGPEGFACQTAEIDLRAGGQWIFTMTAPDGTIWPNRHRYQVMLAPSRIEFLMDDGKDGGSPIEVTVTLEAEGPGTRITQSMILPNAEAKLHALSFGADRLGLQTLGKLAAIAQAEAEIKA